MNKNKILYLNNINVRILAVFIILIFSFGCTTVFSILNPNENSKQKVNLISQYPVSFNTPDDFIISFIETIETINNLNSKKYISETGHFSFLYPTCFQLNENSFEGGEILYHIDMNCKNNNMRGFFQVWSLTESLEKFLNKAEAASSKSISNFSRQPINVNGVSGYEWNYQTTNDLGEKFVAMEGFLEKDKKMYRLSLFVPYDEWTKGKYTIYKCILNSIKIS